MVQRSRKAGTSMFLILTQYPSVMFFSVAHTLCKIDGCSPAAGVCIAVCEL